MYHAFSTEKPETKRRINARCLGSHLHCTLEVLNAVGDVKSVDKKRVVYVRGLKAL